MTAKPSKRRRRKAFRTNYGDATPIMRRKVLLRYRPGRTVWRKRARRILLASTQRQDPQRRWPAMLDGDGHSLAVGGPGNTLSERGGP